MSLRTSALTIGTLVALAACILMLGVPAHAELGKVAIGAPMPDFALSDFTGKVHKLADYKGKVVVLSFMSKDCPWSRGAAPASAAVAKDFAGKGVVYLGVDSNAGVTSAADKAYAEQAKLPYPIVHDEKNAYADAVGATRTPEIYVITKDGKLAYHGAFDDRKEPEVLGTTNYTKLAIDAVLAGKPIDKPEVKAWGCGIQRAGK